jgi:hypothetical protein
MQERLLGMSFPEAPVFFSSSEDIAARLKQRPGQYVLKMPYSSSGRGLLWLSGDSLSGKDVGWIRGALRKQGTLSMEPALSRVADFAMEFYSDGRGKLSYEGLSLFQTNERGAYRGNILQSQVCLRESLLRYIDAATFQRIEEAALSAATYIYGMSYVGHLGIDMLVYQTSDGEHCVHPCVEVNLRRTMGWLAIRLFEQYMDATAKGFFSIAYEGEPLRSRQQQLLMQENHPPVLHEGKLCGGGLSLCPLTEETRYRALITIGG